MAYEHKGEHDKAIADYTDAIRLDPKLTEAYYGRGVAYWHNDQHDKASEDFNQAKKLGYKPK